MAASHSALAAQGVIALDFCPGFAPHDQRLWVPNGGPPITLPSTRRCRRSAHGAWWVRPSVSASSTAVGTAAARQVSPITPIGRGCPSFRPRLSRQVPGARRPCGSRWGWRLIVGFWRRVSCNWRHCWSAHLSAPEPWSDRRPQCCGALLSPKPCIRRDHCMETMKPLVDGNISSASGITVSVTIRPTIPGVRSV